LKSTKEYAKILKVDFCFTDIWFTILGEKSGYMERIHHTDVW
jgi:hypothetical protein